MTASLEKAIELLRQLPEEKQDRIARLLVHEIGEDQRWTQTTAEHLDAAAGIVGEVLSSDDRDECDPLDPERM